MFSSLTAPWWVAGGWALDLFLGSTTRQHHDLDIGVLRRDVATILRALASWQVFAAKAGSLAVIPADKLPARDVNSLWCRPAPTAPWMVEILLDEADGDVWVFRRQPALRQHLSEVIRYGQLGIPYLSPEIQLLYKAKQLREHDLIDFRRTVPALDRKAREWLHSALVLVQPGHEWIAELAQEQSRTANEP